MADPEFPLEGVDLYSELDRLERKLINEALQRSHGNVSAAARLLQLKVSTLHEKLRRRSRDAVAA